jgi:hypothetical protein
VCGASYRNCLPSTCGDSYTRSVCTAREERAYGTDGKYISNGLPELFAQHVRSKLPELFAHVKRVSYLSCLYSTAREELATGTVCRALKE